MGKRTGTHVSRALVLAAVSLLALLGLCAAPATVRAAVTPAPATAVQKSAAPRNAPGSLAVRASAGTPVTPAAAPALPAGTKQACAAPGRIGVEQCLLYLHGNLSGPAAGARLAAAPVTGAYTPANLQGAYNLTTASASDGAGTTVAIVDADGDPDLARDVATYRAQYGLAACDAATGDGCVTIVNEHGGSAPPSATDPTGGWEAEQAADAEMVSAICPRCKIVMVEANSPAMVDLGAAENVAAGLADFVSNSWGGYDFPGDSAEDAPYFDHPGKALVFGAGDAGYGTSYPAVSQLVTSVGGTFLTQEPSAARGWAESVWHDNPVSVRGGTGSGCSAGEGKPSWQTDAGCANRTGNDVSAVASGPAGISVYSSFDSCAGASTGSWCSGFGTSIATPIIAATYALAGTPVPGTYPSSYLYESGHAAHLYPVTAGSDGGCEPGRRYLCDAAGSLASGYNGPAGWGTPDGIAAFANTVSGDLAAPYNPGPMDLQRGLHYAQAIRLSARDSASGATVTYALDGGLPPGLSLDPATGLISGTPTAAGTWSVTVTASDGTANSARSVHFTIGVAPSLEASYRPGAGAVHLNYGGKCLDDSGDAARNGAKIDIWSCDASAAQRWAFYPDTDPGDAGEIVVNGKCLDIKSQGTANGSLADLWSCNGGMNQQWLIVGADGELYNPASGKCLDDPGFSAANGKQLDIWTCDGGNNQAWTLPASPVVSGIGGKCLDDTASAAVNGTKAELWSCTGRANQKWTIGLNGTVRINGKCLDASGYGTADGTRVQLWSCSGTTNQEWEVSGSGQLENFHAEKCLADPGNATGNGTQLVLEDCYGEQGTVWGET